MVLLSANNISKYFGDFCLLNDVAFHIEDHDHIGLIGANGTGKTTLFKMIMDELEPDSGQIYFSRSNTIGYMRQHRSRSPSQTAWDELMQEFCDLSSIELELEQLAEKLEIQGDSPDLINRQHDLHEKFIKDGGLTYKSRAKAAFLGLGFSETDLERKLNSFSGGEQSKISLACLLISKSQLLLLDEPTNHLDISSVEWLEEYLKNFAGAFVVISHDRYFLDRITTKTFEIEHSYLTVYDGNYSQYIDQKEQSQEIVRRHYANQMREVKRIEGIIEQQRRWNRERNIRMAESKQKMLDKLKQTIEKPDSEADTIIFNLTARESSGNDILMVENLSKSFGDAPLFTNASFHIQKGEHVFLLGANGCGKTTLLKIITKQMSPSSGYVKLGAQVDPGYYDQTQESLQPEKSALGEVWDAFPHKSETDVRKALALFLFTGDHVFNPISTLSGGEKARISLLKLMLAQSNLLLLDEPTNHLDIASREALEYALQHYGGTLFIVSHDRYFINKLAHRVLVLRQNGIDTYLGNYDDYQQKGQPVAASLSPKKALEKQPKTNDYKQRKQSESAQRRLLGQVSRLESDIEQQEHLIESIETELLDPSVAADYEQLISHTTKLEEARTRLDFMMAEWTQLSQRIQ